MRIGNGYDIHRLVKGRDLILGGVHIPFEKGLLGHSDADVLIHSICDAILGASGLGDIGEYFPDSDPKYKNINSLILLKKINEMLKNKGHLIINIDSIILAQAPKLKDYKEKMRKIISQTLEIDISNINIKATTTEGLGVIGKKDAIASMSVVLVD